MPPTDVRLVAEARARLRQLHDRFPTAIGEDLAGLLQPAVRPTLADLATADQRPILPLLIDPCSYQTTFRLLPDTRANPTDLATIDTDGNRSEGVQSATWADTPLTNATSTDGGTRTATGGLNTSQADRIARHSEELRQALAASDATADTVWTPLQASLLLPGTQTATILDACSVSILTDPEVLAELVRRATDDPAISYGNLVRCYAWLGWPGYHSSSRTLDSQPTTTVPTEPPARCLIQSWLHAFRAKPKPFVEGWIVPLLGAQQWVDVHPVVGDVLCKVVRESGPSNSTTRFLCTQILTPIAVTDQPSGSDRSPTTTDTMSTIHITWSDAFMTFLHAVLATKTADAETVRLTLTALDRGLCQSPAQATSKKFANLLLALVKAYPALVRPHTEWALAVAARSRTFLRKTIESTLQRNAAADRGPSDASITY